MSDDYLTPDPNVQWHRSFEDAKAYRKDMEEKFKGTWEGGYLQGQKDLLESLWHDVQECCPCGERFNDEKWLLGYAKERAIDLKKD